MDGTGEELDIFKFEEQNVFNRNFVGEEYLSSLMDPSLERGFSLIFNNCEEDTMELAVYEIQDFLNFIYNL